MPGMSKITRGEPDDLDTLKTLIKANRQNREPVVLTDGECRSKDFSCKSKPQVTVLDITKLAKNVEVTKKVWREKAGRPKSRQSKVYPCPCDEYEGPPAFDETSKDSGCACFGKKSPSIKFMETMAKLQERVGDSVQIKTQNFENWGNTQKATVFAAHPRTKEEITKLIRAARENKIRVRSAGSRHSWSRIVADDSYLIIYLDKINSDYDGGAKCRHADRPGQVDVMAGATTGDFKDFQVKNGVHLPCNVILDTVTIVGVIAAGCHGVGWDVKTPGDYVTRMRIFDSDGNLRTYTDDDPAMMRAISANFGTFGIIYDLTIKVIPNHVVRLQNKYMPAKAIFNDPAAFKELVESNWSVELFWFPYNSRSLFDTYDPLEDELFFRIINEDTSNDPEVGKDFYEDQERLDYIAHEGLIVSSWLYRNMPDLTPLLADAAFSILQMVYPEDEQVKQALPHAVHYRKHIHLSPVRDLEFVFDLKNDYAKMNKIIKVALDVTMRYNKKGLYPLNIALEMRWMAYGESYLTPAIIGNPEYGGSGHTFYIEVLSVTETPHWEEYCIDIAKEWFAMGGLPHLAKEWEYLPGVYGHLQKKMGKSIGEFKKQLQKSKADPTGMFMNSTLCRMLNM